MDIENKTKLILIVGPTASGKTALGVEVAKRLDGEVVSADSIQIYKDTDIGSAKPSIDEMCGIPHHLIGSVEINSPKFSVHEYKLMADEAILDIVSRGKMPIVVGGTGLYVNALTYPLNFTSVEPNEELREKLKADEAKEPGILHRRLAEVDIKSAQRLHPNDIKRIIRALEVYQMSGKAISDFGDDFQNDACIPCRYDPIIIGLTMPREVLYARINQRVDDMMERGLLDETKAIFSRGYDISFPALQGLGYRQLIEYLTTDGITLEDAVEKIKRETRRFAKRQLTWFRRDTRIMWLDASEYDYDKTKLADACVKLIVQRRQ